jgi:hypothetical protein
MITRSLVLAVGFGALLANTPLNAQTNVGALPSFRRHQLSMDMLGFFKPNWQQLLSSSFINGRIASSDDFSDPTLQLNRGIGFMHRYSLLANPIPTRRSTRNIWLRTGVRGNFGTHWYSEPIQLPSPTDTAQYTGTFSTGTGRSFGAVEATVGIQLSRTRGIFEYYVGLDVGASYVKGGNAYGIDDPVQWLNDSAFTYTQHDVHSRTISVLARPVFGLQLNLHPRWSIGLESHLHFAFNYTQGQLTSQTLLGYHTETAQFNQWRFTNDPVAPERMYKGSNSSFNYEASLLRFTRLWLSWRF